MEFETVVQEIGNAIRDHGRFLILSHLRPDGDALGCEIAMGLCLQQLGKHVTVWNEDGVPESYRYLPHSEMVEKPPPTKHEFDVVIALDCSTFRRLGSAPDAIANSKLWINIDHHASNEQYGDLILIDPIAPATGQILYELIHTEELPLTYEMADNLYVALSTDTGSFQYPSTTARSFEIAADLIRAGVNVGELSRKMYGSYPRRRIELLRALLNILKFSCDNRVASFTLTQEILRKTGARPEDTEGLIDHIRAIEGVLVALFVEELPEGNVRLSMRSKDRRIDVCKICQGFGGGGHPLASGARISGPLREAEKTVLQAICDEISESASN